MEVTEISEEDYYNLKFVDSFHDDIKSKFYLIDFYSFDNNSGEKIKYSFYNPIASKTTHQPLYFVDSYGNYLYLFYSDKTLNVNENGVIYYAIQYKFNDNDLNYLNLKFYLVENDND